MKVFSIALTLSSVVFAGSFYSSNETDTSTYEANRPHLHYTAPSGWINDPNGLWYDAKDQIWHLYFQYYPYSEYWGEPLYWGHSVSEDLTHWNYSGIAFSPPKNNTGAFSGSIVVDHNNTSGFFNDSIDPRQRAVAFWTYNTPEDQTQFVSYSLDGGYNFTPYSGNPILNISSTQYRDPKVVWHEESQKWILTLAHSQKYEVLIYSSKNLTSWQLESSFSHHGIMGYQYECPGLARVPIVKTFHSDELPSNLTDSDEVWSNSFFDNGTNSSLPDTAWVLFLSVNPGAPLGGSVNQYFIGDFNGTHFVPYTSQTRFLDVGKDFYAFQAFFNSAGGTDVLGIAWASNWEYGQYVPTTPWKSSMSLVRNFTIRQYAPNPESVELNLNSEPILNLDGQLKNETSFKIYNQTLLPSKPLSYNVSKPTGVFEFDLTFTVDDSYYNNTIFADFSILFRGSRDREEYLKIGYEANAASFYIDRGHSKVSFVKENPYFTDRLSVLNEPYEMISSNLSSYKVYGVFDKNILELYFNDGSEVSTNLFFFSDRNFVGEIDISTKHDKIFIIRNFEFRQLR